MSRIEKIKIECPQCHKKQDFNLCYSINVTLDPELKDQLYEGKINLFTCKACGNIANVQNDLLYNDMKNNFMIFFINEEETLNQIKADSSLIKGLSGNVILRIVRSLNELIEKIEMFEKGFNDIIVEILKFSPSKEENGDLNFNKPIFFDGIDESGNQKKIALLIFQDGKRYKMNIPVEDLGDELKRLFFDQTIIRNTKWEIVDRFYAYEWLKNQE